MRVEDPPVQSVARAGARGWVVVATFGPDGPTTCSGLLPVRHSHEELAAQFPGYELVSIDGEDDETPWGTTQQLTAVLLRRAS